MKRSITWLGTMVGSAALIALAPGCSHRGTQAPAPETPPSPTFESSAPSAAPTTPGAPGAQSAPNAPSAPGTAPTQEQAPPQGTVEPPLPSTPPSGGANLPQGSTGQGGEQPMAAPSETERQLCDALGSTAKLRVEDVQNGVAIVMTPRAGQDIAAVRDQAHRVDNMLRSPPVEAPQGPETCGLFSVGRIPGVSTSVSEGRKEVRVILTTKNPAQLHDLRRTTRQQVNNLSKAPGHR